VVASLAIEDQRRVVKHASMPMGTITPDPVSVTVKVIESPGLTYSTAAARGSGMFVKAVQFPVPPAAASFVFAVAMVVAPLPFVRFATVSVA
jgi:hypothetical protein